MKHFNVGAVLRKRTNTIVIHCSATSPEQECNAGIIHEWHKERGWKGIGYHFVIERDGEVVGGRKLHASGAHCKEKNNESIGICLVGGVDSEGNPENNFRDEQIESLNLLVQSLSNVYGCLWVRPHNFYSNKACPSFDVLVWCRDTFGDIERVKPNFVLT